MKTALVGVGKCQKHDFLIKKSIFFTFWSIFSIFDRFFSLFDRFLIDFFDFWRTPGVFSTPATSQNWTLLRQKWFLQPGLYFRMGSLKTGPPRNFDPSRKMTPPGVSELNWGPLKREGHPNSRSYDPVGVMEMKDSTSLVRRNTSLRCARLFIRLLDSSHGFAAPFHSVNSKAIRRSSRVKDQLH